MQLRKVPRRLTQHGEFLTLLYEMVVGGTYVHKMNNAITVRPRYSATLGQTIKYYLKVKHALMSLNFKSFQLLKADGFFFSPRRS